MNRFGVVVLTVLVAACGGSEVAAPVSVVEPAPGVEPAPVHPHGPPGEGILIAELRDGAPVVREGLVFRDAYDDLTKVASTEVVKIGAAFHLVQRAEKGAGSCRISAALLVESPAGLRLAPGGTPVYQECTGVNCTECGFATDEAGAITGCGDCLAAGADAAPAHCDHTISTGLPKLVVRTP